MFICSRVQFLKTTKQILFDETADKFLDIGNRSLIMSLSNVDETRSVSLNRPRLF